MINVHRVTYNGGWREFLTLPEAQEFQAENPESTISEVEKPNQREPYIHETSPGND